MEVGAVRRPCVGRKAWGYCKRGYRSRGRKEASRGKDAVGICSGLRKCTRGGEDEGRKEESGTSLKSHLKSNNPKQRGLEKS